MKSSCLVKVLIIGTIILAIIFYFLTNLPKPAKEMAVDFVFKKLQERLVIAQAESEDKEEVVRALHEYTDDLLNKDAFNLNEIGRVSDTLKHILNDNVITTEESQKFKEYIEEVIANEGRKKD